MNRRDGIARRFQTHGDAVAEFRCNPQRGKIVRSCTKKLQCEA